MAGKALTLGPLRHNRDFAILWSGQTVSEFGSSMSVLVFPLIGYSITGSPAQAGLATTAVLLGRVVSRLPAGALVDRWSRRSVLAIAPAGAALLYGSLAVAAFAHSLTLGHLIVVGLLSGVADSFVDPASSAAVRTVVAPEDLPVAFSQSQARRHAASLAGPPLGGALYSVARGLPFAVDAVSYGVEAVAALALRTPLPAPNRTADGSPRSLRRDMAEGLRFVWQHTAVRAIMLWGAMINLSVDLALVVITLRLVRAGTHPASIGLVDTIAASAGLLGAIVAPALTSRLRTGVTTILTGLVLAVAFVPVAFTNDVALIGVVLAVGFFLLPANNAGISAYMVSVVPDRLQGRVNSAAGFVANSVTPLGPVIAGVLVQTVSARLASLIAAALVASALVPLLGASVIRQLGRPADWAASPQT